MRHGHPAPYLLTVIDQHVAGKPSIRLEVSKLMFADSSCLAVFLEVVRCGKQLILVRPSPAVRRVIELAGVLDLPAFEVED